MVSNILKADMILINGKIVTVDLTDSIVEAVAIKDGRILATGSNEKVLCLIGKETGRIDLEGRTVLPGFIDTHSHPSVAAEVLLQINCISPPTRSIQEILAKIREKATTTPNGEWIKAINYNQLKLEEQRHITRKELDEAAPDNPVIITRLTGHMYILNSPAIELAGLTRDTPDPIGGEIERDENGEPTGLLHGNAGGLALKLLPPFTIEELKESLRRVYDQYGEWGITSVHDPGVTGAATRAFKQLAEEGDRRVRVQMMMRTHRESPRITLQEMTALGIESGYGDDWVRIMSLKIMGDGTGSGGTAGVYKPNRRTGGFGLFMTSPDEIKELTVAAQKAGIRVSVHAIGDKAIDATLDAIQEAQRLHPRPDMRHRIEHCSISTPKQLERIKELGAAPAASIGYMWSIGDDYLDNFGPERARWFHPLRTMKEMGIVAGGNCDYPITDGNPMKQIWEAVTRETMTGQVISPEECIDVMDAIRLYTWNGAYLEKAEDVKGSTEPGKFADMVVLDRNILSVPVDEIKDVWVLTTIVNGKIVYQRD
jgi:predicted amidohydrolase YtcJ